MVDRVELVALAKERGLGLLVDVGVNILLPLAIYSLTSARLHEIGGLLASSVPPILWSFAELVRHRRVDALSLLMIAGIALSILAFFGGGSARMLQLREKLVTAVIGVVFLGSALIGRPLIYQLAVAGMRRSGSADLADFEARREDKGFRRTMTIMTVVWGVGLIADVAAGAVLIFTVSIREYLVIGPVLGYATMGGLSLWTLWYSARKKREGEARRAAWLAEQAGPAA